MVKLNFDCLNLIFDELKTKKKFLRPCLLVNKDWCNISIVILWKNYSWNIKRPKSEKKLFNIILSFLPSSSKKILYDNDINLLPSSILLKTSPLFNYISFCKFPEFEIIKKIIIMMFGKINYYNDNKKNILVQEIYKLFVNYCKDIKELHLQTSQPLSSFPGASACFSRLCNLYIDMGSVNSDILHGMAQTCKDLNILSIYNCSEDIPGLISLIDAQRNLKGLHLNTKKADIKRLQQCLATSEFPDLKALGVSGLSCFKELSMLIEKTRGNISRIYVFINNRTAENTGMLIKSISENCPKITFLRTYLKPKDFTLIKSLLLNCRHLDKIRFDNIDNNNINNWDIVEDKLCNVSNIGDIGDELLDILAKFSPKSLTYITISEDWKYSIDALNRFFESFRERNLLDFEIIHHDLYYITEYHRDVIRKYINEGVIVRSNCTEWRLDYWDLL